MARDFTARPYGGLITDHILDVPRCAVWAGMGLGKTVSTLNALNTLQLIDDAPVLVLAPLRVARSTWPDEARKWAHLRHLSVMPIVGGEAERRMALRHDANIYTTNYENLPWLVEHFGERWPFRTVVSDESTKLKGFRLRQGTQRAKALGRVAHTKIDRFIELTGTPSPNGLMDLWGQAWFLDAGARLGRTFDGFKTRWFRPSHDGYGSLPMDHAQREIQDKLRDLCITIDAKDWFDLREPIVNNLYVDLPIKARQLYQDMEKQMFMQLEEHEVEAFGAAARTVKCLQIANGAAYVGENSAEWKEIHDAKLQALEDIAEEAGGMPILVAYNFKSDLARLRAAFPKGRHLDANPQTIVDWNAGCIPMLFAHPASAGHGLNLQDGGNILVFFAHDWNLENRLQIIERIGPTRQMQAGHDRPMFIHNIIARDTVDEMVIERVETKREVQDILLSAMKLKGYK
ncbi:MULTISPECIES: DEAD/DEAH box helicase [unclassified Janthinobacterium]|uniref:DEAD/DEAH box helicase n=1 Tax=unclassified Janthinobacterium TaxID=2610881 RepID=UPI0003486373|nr:MULTISPECIES: DEAD/DEAH box helicase [unclassified Janthinobacterium]MEC5161684.1 SNF2 family DNA or RNA helicase [Janthinobacterium sp. CG_S6]